MHYKKSTPYELASLAPHTTLWLDLEIDPDDKSFIVGAFCVDTHAYAFDKQTLFSEKKAIIALLNLAKYLGGHNLIEFDLPHLATWLDVDDDTLQSWHIKALDTLYLSSLVLPHKPSHALIKLYKVATPNNDPIQDCLLSATLWAECKQAWEQLPSVVQCLYLALLPIGKLPFVPIAIGDVGFDELAQVLPSGNHAALFSLIHHALESEYDAWEQLGLCAFVGWLLHFDKPTCRRPVWLTHHAIFADAFHLAESAFWQLDTLSDEFLNQQFFEFFQFKNPDGTPASLRMGQLDIIRAVLTDKDIPLGVLATGGGKSLTFQLPALILSRYQRKMSVIVSPLKALIQDQVINLQAVLEQSPLAGFAPRVAYLTSGQGYVEQKRITQAVWEGQIDILYLSPERLRTFEIKTLLKNRPPAFWVLDETHTFSQWGVDFRPDFLRIAEHMAACYGITVAQLASHQSPKKSKQPQLFADVHETAGRPRILLVTATASGRVKDDLQTELVGKLTPLIGNRPLVQYGTPLDELKIWRDEIVPEFLQVASKDKKHEILALTKQCIADYDSQHGAGKGVVLVYVRNRKKCEQYAKALMEQGIIARAYHGKLSEGEKSGVLDDFKADKLQVVVCTNAFGMGIDKAGIHTVIHNEPPNNLESYVQEIGRCARKSGERGQAFLFWCEQDLEKLFQAERDSRIANSKTLHDFWRMIKPTLAKPAPERWFSASVLQELLAQSDSENLTTQVRVALLALERYGLLQEKEQFPAWIELKLLPIDRANRAIDEQLYQFYDALLPHTTIYEEALHGAENAQKSEFCRFYLPQLALIFGLNVKGLIGKLRKLVEYNLAVWEVSVRLRLPKSLKTTKSNFDKLKKQLGIWQCLIEQFDWQAFDNDFEFNATAVEHFISKEQLSAKPKALLACLSALDVLDYRIHSASRYKISPSETLKNYCQLNELTANWQIAYQFANAQLSAATPLFEHLLDTLKETGESVAFNLTNLAKNNQLLADELLDRLQILANLKLVEMTALGDERGSLFFVDKPKNAKNNYNSIAYEYLQRHYEDRCGRIHFLCHWLMTDDIDKKRTMLEAYFKLPLQEILETYLPNPAQAKKPYLHDVEQTIIAPYFSDVQKAIITDASRATMVLAGAGSGKTTVVVHRVAYLLMIEQIDPAKILVLAYNRLAVSELTTRLYALVGKASLGVNVTTFHGLARQITGMSEADFEDGLTDDICKRYPYLLQETNAKKRQTNASYQWLLEQALEELSENPQVYQYIMVDEFQDIDRLQYEMIARLADFKELEGDEEQDKITAKPPKKHAEQQGYLMVVGDDDQNLYSFRGASIEFIQQFEQSYQVALDNKHYLLGNYRSSPKIVTLANEFIKNAICADKRLKGELESVAMNTGENVAIRWTVASGYRPQDWAYWIAHDILAYKSHLDNGEKIAVIAPYWYLFDYIAHYLEQLNIAYRQYNQDESGQFSPHNSFIGQKLIEHVQNMLALENEIVIDNVAEFLEEWRLKCNFNTLDNAWQAIMNGCGHHRNIDCQTLLSLIYMCQYDNHEPVILITHHSAKGLEFDRVYVIDYFGGSNNHPARTCGDDEHSRQLYVALTRAKVQLTVVQIDKKSHQVLNFMLSQYANFIEIPKIDKPKSITYHRYLGLTEIWNAPPDLVNESGRKLIENVLFLNNWDYHKNPVHSFMTTRISKNKNQPYAFARINDKTKTITNWVLFSESFKEQLHHKTLTMMSFATMNYYQKDRELWYQ